MPLRAIVANPHLKPVHLITDRAKRYFVYIHKAYFPTEPAGRPGKEDFEQWTVTAKSRKDAAEQIWREHGSRLLELMKPAQTRLPRKVSLYVSDPIRGTAAGRLQPITVHTGNPHLKPVHLITDRAKRYRAQSNVPGPRRCVICGTTGRLDVMHLDGNEANGESSNLAYGCRSCNGKLAAAFKRIGAGVPTRQYNPSSGTVPTFAQYGWAVSQHTRGAHDEGGAIIHATPRHKRIEYARRIADLKRGRRGAAYADEVPF